MSFGDVDRFAIFCWSSVDNKSSNITVAVFPVISTLDDCGILHGDTLITEAVFLLFASGEWIAENLILAEGVATVVGLSGVVVECGVQLTVGALHAVVDQ
jgi:hypothetical protein